MMHGEQYQIDFSSRTNDRCAMLNKLRDTPLEIDGKILSHGRVNGVVELLQRLTVLAKYLPEDIRETFSLDAQVMAIAARIARRRTVCERTVRNWARDAIALGLIERVEISHQFGGHNWNRYAVNFGEVMSAISGGNGRQRAATVSAPRAETVAALGAETVSAPTNVTTNEITTPPLVDEPSSEPHTDRDPWEVVVSDLILEGMSNDGARGAVRAAQSRHLTHADVGELMERYRQLQRSDSHVTVGWLHRWIIGKSSPPKPSAATVAANQRGDAWSAEAVRSESTRTRIVRDARKRKLTETAIAELCQMAGVEY